ncbi:hypothetical protein KC343_g14268 [Hortaea werneckii]|nr:hypothetical protein KC352_g27846 [Hortaea werneckii]KAI7550341.1 hypothetical protein KC317_g14307 [Hortaea werneckii]KAI7598720.1 hypothetical protein KC346_g14102 [Hortaea werneckii]KAI7604029.1 hypothetical protein KC343_g14268 [Hortaea werneckii]KAI7640400.1 hypothetical protein KC319_g14002 [Hortaea werneckii]
MPSIDATVAWAVPVEVEVLGAHLEAYVNLQPTINTLRMCHRFGKGDQAAITKLPVELLNEIEDILMEEERRKRREEWETDFRCFQLHCDLRDHIDPSEIDDLTRQFEDDVRLDYSFEEWTSCLDFYEFVEERVNEFLFENILDKTHWERRERWRIRVGESTSRVGGLLSLLANAALFQMHFGLAIWTSHVYVGEPLDHCFRGDGIDHGGETTVAYLMLSSQRQRFARQWPLSEDKNGNLRDDDVVSGYGLRLKEAKALAESDVRRFKRAMNILGLQPRVHGSQSAAWNSDGDEGKECLVDCKPQLTVLLRSSSF